MYVVIIGYLRFNPAIKFSPEDVAHKIQVIKWNIVDIQQFKLLLWCDSVMQLQTKLNWKHLHVGCVSQDISFSPSVVLRLQNDSAAPSVLFAPVLTDK